LRKTLVSIMIHPQLQPALTLEYGDGLPPIEVIYNRRTPYGSAFQQAFHHAYRSGQNLVVCDGDGYHQRHEVERLVEMTGRSDERPLLIKPHRTRMGLQSQLYSRLFNARYGMGVRDPTSGLYAITHPAIRRITEQYGGSWNKDFSVHIQLLKRCHQLGIKILQYRQEEGRNPRETSHRARLYRLSLLMELL
jgi:glycosyltransferase involved in cell wall biosynthesis